MSPALTARLLCCCSGCETVFQLTVSQLSARAGLVRCSDCGSVFNAAWNLVNEIPNPAETATPVALEPTTSSTRSRSRPKVTDNTDSGPGFADGEHLFSLDDQLRHDLQLGGNGNSALEEIRQTLGPADVESAPRERRTLLFRSQKQSRTKATARSQHDISHLIAKESLAPNRLQTVASLPKQRRVPIILWLLATITALASLFIQVRFVLFDELAVISSARAPLETFCRALDCRVPPPLTGPIFRVLQTRVDLDPQLPGAVVVKVHLVNRTTTPRTYPSIQLSLTDRNGEIIGRRTYFAQDYGQGTVGNKLVPGGVAVVTLHLANPNERAVGFETTIVNTNS